MKKTAKIAAALVLVSTFFLTATPLTHAGIIGNDARNSLTSAPQVSQEVFTVAFALAPRLAKMLMRLGYLR